MSKNQPIDILNITPTKKPNPEKLLQTLSNKKIFSSLSKTTQENSSVDKTYSFRSQYVQLYSQNIKKPLESSNQSDIHNNFTSMQLFDKISLQNIEKPYYSEKKVELNQKALSQNKSYYSDDKIQQMDSSRENKDRDFLKPLQIVKKNLASQFDEVQTQLSLSTPCKKIPPKQNYNFPTSSDNQKQKQKTIPDTIFETPNQKKQIYPLIENNSKNKNKNDLNNDSGKKKEDWNFRNKDNFKQSVKKDLEFKQQQSQKKSNESQTLQRNQTANKKENLTEINNNNNQIQHNFIQQQQDDQQICFLPYVKIENQLYPLYYSVQNNQYQLQQQSQIPIFSYPFQQQQQESLSQEQYENFLDENYLENCNEQQQSDIEYYKPKYNRLFEQNFDIPQNVIQQIGKKPQKPLSSFWMYYQEQLPYFTSHYPYASQNQIQQHILYQWLHQETQENKQKYIKVANQRRKLYFKEIRSYLLNRDKIIDKYLENKNENDKNITHVLNSDHETPKFKTKYKSAKQLFLIDIIGDIKNSYPKLTPQQKKVIVKEKWQRISEEKRQQYVEQSRFLQKKALQELHKEEED